MLWKNNKRDFEISAFFIIINNIYIYNKINQATMN